MQVVPSKFDTVFDPNKTYFLVGCLGGLGRSISKWMHSRGARNFLFLNRSGLESHVASEFVSDLQSSGAQVKVIRGDVSEMSDVEDAVKALWAPLGGVIQAAMGLNLRQARLIVANYSACGLEYFAFFNTANSDSGVPLHNNDQPTVAGCNATQSYWHLEHSQCYSRERERAEFLSDDKFHIWQRWCCNRSQLLRF